MSCNIEVYCNGSHISKTKIVGTAYRIFKDGIFIKEERKAFGNFSGSVRKYIALETALDGIISLVENGIIPINSTINLYCDKEVMDDLRNDTLPEELYGDSLFNIRSAYHILLKSFNFSYAMHTDETSYCGTNINQYLSKLSYFSALEYLKQRGGLHNLRLVNRMLDLECELGVAEIHNPEYLNIIEDDYILSKKDFRKYNIALSEHFVFNWLNNVFESENNQAIIKYILDCINRKHKGLKHIKNNKYYINSKIICDISIKNNIIYFNDLVVLEKEKKPAPVRKLNNILKRMDFLNHELEISSHFIKRWHERVCAEDNVEQIRKFILNSALKNRGIKHEYKKFYSLNDDVVCIIEPKGETILFRTTYGKKSENPILNNIPALYDTISKYGKVELFNDAIQ